MISEYDSHLHETLSQLDERAEKSLMKRTASALLADGDVIYVRRIEGRLQWIEANIHGGSKEWKELTPHLAMDRLAKRNVGEVDEESLEKLRDMLVAAQNPDAHEIGLYQDVKGDLYQFDGNTWMGAVPTKEQKQTLEYLGK
jgi:hypothetical protein